MQVIAKVMLQYGIIRPAGAQFELTDPKHFDKRVMTKVEASKKRAKKAAEPTAEQAAEAARKAEAERLAASNAQAKTDEAKTAAPAQPVSRRRSTADTK